MISLYIPGEAVAKARPRMTRSGHTYTPAKTKNYEAYIKSLFCQEYPHFAPMEGEIAAEISVYSLIPNSKSKKQKALMKSGYIRPQKKPDCDNLAKGILDALNGLAYQDDRQVVDLGVHKYYSDQPRAEVIIRELKPQAS